MNRKFKFSERDITRSYSDEKLKIFLSDLICFKSRCRAIFSITNPEQYLSENEKIAKGKSDITDAPEYFFIKKTIYKHDMKRYMRLIPSPYFGVNKEIDYRRSFEDNRSVPELKLPPKHERYSPEQSVINIITDTNTDVSLI